MCKTNVTEERSKKQHSALCASVDEKQRKKMRDEMEWNEPILGMMTRAGVGEVDASGYGY